MWANITSVLNKVCQWPLTANTISNSSFSNKETEIANKMYFLLKSLHQSTFYHRSLFFFYCYYVMWWYVFCVCVCFCSKCISYDVVIIFKASWNVLRKLSELPELPLYQPRPWRQHSPAAEGPDGTVQCVGVGVHGHSVGQVLQHQDTKLVAASQLPCEQKHREPFLVLSGRNCWSRLVSPANVTLFQISCLSFAFYVFLLACYKMVVVVLMVVVVCINTSPTEEKPPEHFVTGGSEGRAPD